MIRETTDLLQQALCYSDSVSAAAMVLIICLVIGVIT